ncbi:NAD-dependent protein deacylase [Acetilactobacillus jinshanensis]|uniref:protein acetyllysine N-acetyltransferase n=1 Tax=Acetilactobacillus jinshanensis TaxID=1720083 RepID=A0A4P6ZKZ9_9LACO|nr:NAD-dependent protein deacylase [Acetilactobacillus jinshanensis]QBP18384.1 NAD-dependent protein deacylase [Acetilactobacillus jinshanensis]URL61254.1 NAD-dependent protein deacylase [uncultured bacterium]
MDPKIQKLFDKSKHIVFLTGAGVSTASGIPDYRSKGGLYTQNKANNKPAEWYLSHDCLMNYPKTFYKFMKAKMYYPDAKPNAIHEAQAKLTREGRASIITQNVDNLYNKAHAKKDRLVEFHGNIYHCHCLKCGKSIPWQQYLKSPIHKEDGGQIRPNLVLYGEGMKYSSIIRALQMMREADLVVIVGTAMAVAPFNMLNQYKSPSAPVIMINEQKINRIPFVPHFTMLQMDATKFFKELHV